MFSKKIIEVQVSVEIKSSTNPSMATNYCEEGIGCSSAATPKRLMAGRMQHIILYRKGTTGDHLTALFMSQTDKCADRLCIIKELFY